MIAFGHRDVWDYSPRQTAAFLRIASKRRQREFRQQLALHFAAAQGEPKAIQKMLAAKAEQDDEP